MHFGGQICLHIDDLFAWLKWHNHGLANLVKIYLIVFASMHEKREREHACVCFFFFKVILWVFWFSFQHLHSHVESRVKATNRHLFFLISTISSIYFRLTRARCLNKKQSWEKRWSQNSQHLWLAIWHVYFLRAVMKIKNPLWIDYFGKIIDQILFFWS